MSKIQEPVRIGAWDLPNRVVMAPLTRCRASEGRVPNAMMAEYYKQRSSAGLILSEATSISPQGVGYPDTPGLWSAEQVEGWKLVTSAVHEAGGRIIAQLWHVGRVSDPHYLDGELPVSASAIAAPGHVSILRPQRPHVTPRALELSEIPGIIEDYRKAAENALAAGFDGVEIHGANGYLPHQFLNDRINVRTDSFGGSIENRARFMLEAVDAAISVWGPDRVGLHLSPNTEDDSDAVATYGFIAREATARGIAFLFVREPLGADPRISRSIRKSFTGAFIANQELTKEQGDELLAANEADAISYGRLYIANPDLVERLAAAAPLNEPDGSTFYGGGPEGYLDYPTLEELNQPA
ncbi:alkene reductase [Luteolibacter flavescens]|uniref:Alkene reductase n=1 Tax=Luteolibacter flavescens TaxID=1859460 RepID=A0ABT3FNS4_9BACT|nr:alkene reductase [Luteolibacter flavescens]MCW1884984.1 alkene reductase [Luteolibacter flavescens]